MRAFIISGEELPENHCSLPANLLNLLHHIWFALYDNNSFGIITLFCTYMFDLSFPVVS